MSPSAAPADDPLVLFLHGFPEFWWAWRHQLPVVAAAGYRAVAMDLRGYGASDKTPRGYDPYTAAADVSGVIRSLGATDAVVVGHGWGGFIGWSAAVLAPRQVRGLAAVSAPHPLLLARSGQTKALTRTAWFQLPILPERRLLAHDGIHIERLLRAWSAPGRHVPRRRGVPPLPRRAAGLAGSALRARVPPLVRPVPAAPRRPQVLSQDAYADRRTRAADPRGPGPRGVPDRDHPSAPGHGAAPPRTPRRRRSLPPRRGPGPVQHPCSWTGWRLTARTARRRPAVG